DDPDTVTGGRADLFEQGLTNLHAEIFDELRRVELGRKADDLTNLFAQRIGDHQKSSRRTHIDRDGNAVLRIDVEKRRSSAADLLARLGAFAHEAFLKKLIYEARG